MNRPSSAERCDIVSGVPGFTKRSLPILVPHGHGKPPSAICFLPPHPEVLGRVARSCCGLPAKMAPVIGILPTPKYLDRANVDLLEQSWQRASLEELQERRSAALHRSARGENHTIVGGDGGRGGRISSQQRVGSRLTSLINPGALAITERAALRALGEDPGRQQWHAERNRDHKAHRTSPDSRFPSYASLGAAA